MSAWFSRDLCSSSLFPSFREICLLFIEEFHGTVGFAQVPGQTSAWLPRDFASPSLFPSFRDFFSGSLRSSMVRSSSRGLAERGSSSRLPPEGITPARLSGIFTARAPRRPAIPQGPLSDAVQPPAPGPTLASSVFAHRGPCGAWHVLKNGVPAVPRPWRTRSLWGSFPQGR